MGWSTLRHVITSYIDLGSIQEILDLYWDFQVNYFENETFAFPFIEGSGTVKVSPKKDHPMKVNFNSSKFINRQIHEKSYMNITLKVT